MSCPVQHLCNLACNACCGVGEQNDLVGGGGGDVVQLYCYGGCGGQDLGQVQGKVTAISDKAMQIHKPKLGVRKGFSTRKAVHLVVVDVAPCKINQSCPEVRGNKFQMPQRRGVAALVSGLLKQR